MFPKRQIRCHRCKAGTPALPWPLYPAGAHKPRFVLFGLCPRSISSWGLDPIWPYAIGVGVVSSTDSGGGLGHLTVGPCSCTPFLRSEGAGSKPTQGPLAHGKWSARHPCCWSSGKWGRQFGRKQTVCPQEITALLVATVSLWLVIVGLVETGRAFRAGSEGWSWDLVAGGFAGLVLLVGPATFRRNRERVKSGWGGKQC